MRTLDAEVTLRPLRHADIPAHVALLAAIEAVDHTGEHYGEEDLAEEYANPDIELGKDLVGAWEASDSGEELVGYFSVYPRRADDTHLKVHLEGGVRPDRRGRGIGWQLASAMVARATAIHAEAHAAVPAKLSLSGVTDNEEQARLLADAGFVAERYSFAMRTGLGDVAEPGPVPEGYRVLRYDDAWSAAMLAAHNEAFLDHPNFTRWTEVMWRQWVTESRNFRPVLSLVAVHEDDPDTVVAYVQSNEYDAYYAATGRREAYVAKVGTRREHRGRGLAGLLLQHALRGYQRAGFDEAALDVDSENPTGALGIYERAGFVVETRWTNYALTLPAAP